MKTDDSLRTERRKSDDALRRGHASAARDADGVLDHARDVADAVLSAARVKADNVSVGRQRPEAGALIGERAMADRLVFGERATADIALRIDRKDRTDVLEALLVHERAATDAFLLTERADSDEALAHRDDFLGMVAHDLRNLLHVIVVSLELLRPVGADQEPTPEVAGATARIRRYVARMNRLIGDLVDVTSIDAGKLAMAPSRCDAGALVTEATETFQPAAVEQGVSLSAEVPPAPVLAEFDHERMLQVFANLISNALKFTPKGGKITVRVDEGRGVLRFAVSDTGVGVPASMLDRIFERFWQVGADDRRGQGLGLYISKCIVEAHRGRIWAESEGKGTRLYFTLPAASSRRHGRPASGHRAGRNNTRVARRGDGKKARRRA